MKKIIVLLVISFFSTLSSGEVLVRSYSSGDSLILEEVRKGTDDLRNTEQQAGFGSLIEIEIQAPITDDPAGSSLELDGFSNGGGFTGGGGGTTSLVNNQRILDDYFLIDQEFVDMNSYTHKGETYSKLIWSKDEDIKKQWLDSGPYKLFNKILEEWRALPLSLVDMQFGFAIDGPVTWSLVDGDVEGDHTAYYKKSYDNSNRRNFFEIIIAQSKWDMAGIWSQTGLIAHESLRHAQIGGSSRGRFFDDETLKKATAIFVLCKPRPMLSTYLMSLLMEREKEFFYTNNSMKNFDDLVGSYCDRR